MTVHRVDCHNIINEKEKERLVPVQWGRTDLLYPVNIQIEAWDRVGLISDISTVVAEEKVNIASVNLVHGDGQKIIVDLTLETRGLAHLSQLMKKLDAVKSIISVNRTGMEAPQKAVTHSPAPKKKKTKTE